MHHLYYCPGGGLGHIARGHRVMAALAPGESYSLISASPALARAEVRCGATAIELPRVLEGDRHAHRIWLAEQFEAHAPCCVWVDAFPAGIVGELCDFAWPGGVRAQHVARRLRWEVYCRRLDGALPHYASIHLVEPLPSAQVAALAACTGALTAIDLPLAWPHAQSPPAVAGAVLVVHSGAHAETSRLVELAQREMPDTQPVVVTCGASEPPLMRAFPVWPMFAAAARVYSGAGFNAVLEARAAPEKHRLLAFERALDDQSARLAHFLRAGAGRASLRATGLQAT